MRNLSNEEKINNVRSGKLKFLLWLLFTACWNY